ncbi:MAG: MFS transporter [Gammaproteobacteria bacterium]
MTDTEQSRVGLLGWWKFWLVSLIFFQITASTFTSLGVALPFMIEELSWSWSSAGVGFSLLSFMVGITGWLPAMTMRRFGTRATYAIGGVLMAAGFALIATTPGLMQYLVGAAITGVGYTLCATVPGVAVINHWLPKRRAFAIGAYMTIGGLGGVAGPLIVTGVVAVTGTWRMHWWVMCVSILLLTVLAAFTLKSSGQSEQTDTAPEKQEQHGSKVFVTATDWTLREVLRTPQYFVIVAALTMTLFGGVTTNTWAVTHMGNLGIAAAVAATALSTHALVNSFSRAFGGALATWIDPKWLLVSALVAEIVGMLSLAVADNLFTIALFVAGEGYGFGMCFFATTMLLVNYYGPKEAPKTMGTMHFITTIAMLGPVLGGYVADTYGTFAGVFRGYAVLMCVCLVAVAFMRPPTRQQAPPQ